MASWSASAIRFYIQYIRRSKAIFGSAKAITEHIEETHLHPQNFSPPTNLGSDLAIKRIDIDSRPLYCLSSTSNLSQQAPRRAILYLHGGSFYKEIDPLHWKLVAQLARETKLDVLVSIYPLLPRPTATAAQVVQGLVDLCRMSSHEVVCVAGDSAGGNLALATVQHLQKVAPDAARKLKALVLISPVLDAALNHPEAIRLAQHDPWLALEGLREVVAPKWAAGLPIKDYRVSPLHGKIDDLPPVLLLCGTADLLCADARRLSARFQGKSVDEIVEGSAEAKGFTYIEYPDMVHVYPILPIWEGGEARKQIVEFIKKNAE
jgi:acetyl esterase/lipase